MGVNEKKCERCRNLFTKCKCTRDSILTDKGSLSATTFGYDRLEYSFIKIDHRIVMKIKLRGDYIYLDTSAISSIHSATGEFLELQKTLEQKRLMGWECNSCGKKTNNMQEWCDACIELDYDKGCDC